MAELWELCNNRSQAVLIQLYWEEHKCYPDFWYKLSNKEPVKPVINAPDYQEMEDIELERTMQLPPLSEGRGY